ncbi:MAG: hypothetical protein D6704_09090 [Nitrospirae bacterium]|nr:MAG: hypothetical protein D6704_09090 [Nitrospirota bacterium]
MRLTAKWRSVIVWTPLGGQWETDMKRKGDTFPQWMSSLALNMPRIWGVGLLSMLVGASPAGLAAQPYFSQDIPDITPGLLLIARPELRDPHFAKTVVLICRHDERGSIGLILNRPTTMPLSKALPRLKGLKGNRHYIYEGGPVQPRGIIMLFYTETQPAKTTQVLEHLYVGGDQESLEELLANPNETSQFRVYAGHASWFPGQLETEITRGVWWTVMGDPNTVFDPHPATLWDQLYLRLTAPRRMISFSSQ